MDEDAENMVVDEKRWGGDEGGVKVHLFLLIRPVSGRFLSISALLCYGGLSAPKPRRRVRGLRGVSMAHTGPGRRVWAFSRLLLSF